MHDYTDHIDSVERSEWLAMLTVERLTDEFGEFRYFIIDPFTGDHIGDVYGSADLAFGAIDQMRKEAS